MENKIVSIIVPVYNCEKYLTECLESILHQTYSFWECILIDDGSTDSSAEICDEYSKKDQRFIVVHKKNSGISSTRNYSLKYIRGEYMTFIDSDDCVDMCFLEIGIKYIEESKSDIIQFASTRDAIFLGTKKNSKLIKLNENQVRNDILQFRKITPTVWGKLYCIKMINKFRFNESCYILEDVEYLTQLMLNCTCALSEYIGYYYRITPESLMNQEMNTQKLIGSIECQNSCIRLLKETELKVRAYQFKYESLFNWLIRTANQDNWAELYQIIRRQIVFDIKYISYFREIRWKVKILLYACAISPFFAHIICETIF